MLRYGNFVYGYRTLCRIATQDLFGSELGELPIGEPNSVKYKDRTPALLQLAPIPRELLKYLSTVVPELEQQHQHLKNVQLKGARNQEIYLTWDHMDVYFATSMRKSWQYPDLYAFVAELTQDRKLQRLNIRQFDPTQSYADQRIDKGLVESLMLKRAKCTVYSVQDTDTLGKDSDLAPTLGWLAIFGVVLVPASLLTFTWAERYAKKTGKLKRQG